MPVRHEYRLDLAVANPRADLHAPVGMFVRAVSPGDLLKLAELMLDAYRNTIDYEGEGIAEALAEVADYFSRAAKYPAISQLSLHRQSEEIMGNSRSAQRAVAC